RRDPGREEGAYPGRADRRPPRRDGPRDDPGPRAGGMAWPRAARVLRRSRAPRARRAPANGGGGTRTAVTRDGGAGVGRWQATVTELATPYVMPQENGGRADVRWLELSDASGARLRLAFEQPMQVSATHHRAAD